MQFFLSGEVVDLCNALHDGQVIEDTQVSKDRPQTDVDILFNVVRFHRVYFVVDERTIQIFNI